MTDDELASVAGTGHICPVSTGDENSSRERLAQLAPRNALAIGDRCPLSAICYLLFTTVAIRSSHRCPHSNLIWRSDRTRSCSGSGSVRFHCEFLALRG